MRHKTYPTSLTLSLSRPRPRPRPPASSPLSACLVAIAVVIVVADVVVVGHDMTARNMMKGPIGCSRSQCVSVCLAFFYLGALFNLACISLLLLSLLLLLPGLLLLLLLPLSPFVVPPLG